MATLMHNTKYPCAFDLRLLRWERYTSEKRGNSNVETVALGEPYTLWVKYRMALRVGNLILYQSGKDTTLILEDVKRLIEDLRQLAHGKEDKITFNPIEPDFGLNICKITKSNASVIASSHPSNLFDVKIWIDYPNQVEHSYGGYGPGLYFFVEALDIEQFASQLEEELNALGPYFARKEE